MKPSILNKFTTHLRNTLTRASDLAVELRNTYVNPEHFLYGLAEQKGGIAFDILNKSGLTIATLRDFVRMRNEPVPDAPLSREELHFSLPAKRAVEKAVLIANKYEHKYVGTEHLLFALMEINDPTLAQLFRESSMNLEETKRQLEVVLKSTSKFPDLAGFFEQTREATEEEVDRQVTVDSGKAKSPALNFFAVDLTNKEVQKDIDPVIGRAREIERLIHILSRRTKNNPVLIGDPGVGKTAIVEGLAKRIVEGDVPDALLRKRILNLDLPLVVAGTIYRGEFESRLKQIIDEIKADPSIILFIDELHTIMGAGSASGSMDAANILKPALAKGAIRVIGATTLEEYRKHIEADAALERRFQPIIVEEPTLEATMEILKGIRANYERFHRVEITDDAIEAAVRFSQRYLQEKFQPDKSIDLIDEASSKLKVSQKPSPTMVEVRQLERQLADLREQKQKAVAQENFSTALSYKSQEADVEARVRKLHERDWRGSKKRIGKITAQEVADIVSRMTGIPLADLLKVDRERLLHLEQRLRDRIIGQDEAIGEIANAIRRSRVGLANPNRPLGSFIFLGPSGVGKTETAKVIAERVFEDPSALIRVDMSEFGESFNVSKLIGAPAGYVGYKDTNKLTDAVRRKPYAVVLFDEIEKAHPDVFNLFLQILDEGAITDAAGKRVNFKNTIIIMTSNVGLQELNRVQAMGFATASREEAMRADESYRTMRDHLLDELQKQFRPEFLNRIDKTIVFRPLTLAAVEQIVDLQLQDLGRRLRDRRIVLDVSAKARRKLARQGFTPEQGARALQRTIQQEIENPLAGRILSGTVRDGSKVKIGLRKDAYTFEATPLA